MSFTHFVRRNTLSDMTVYCKTCFECMGTGCAIEIDTFQASHIDFLYLANALMYAVQHLRDMLPGYWLTISTIKAFLDPMRDSLSLPEASQLNSHEFLYK